jgi:hypothetical protein
MASRLLYRLFLLTLLIIPAVGVIPTMASFWVSISWGDKVALGTMAQQDPGNTGNVDPHFKQVAGVTDAAGKEQEDEKR